MDYLVIYVTRLVGTQKVSVSIRTLTTDNNKIEFYFILFIYSPSVDLNRYGISHIMYTKYTEKCAKHLS